MDEIQRRWGRPITIELRRQRVVAIVLGVAALLVVMALILAQIPDTYRRSVAAHLVAYLGAFPMALYLGVLAFRVATWPAFHVRLTRTTLEFPALHGLFARQVELELAALEDVGFVSNQGTIATAVWSGGKRYHVAVPRWLPEGWTVGALTRVIHLRRAAARQGLSGPELAAIEAASDDASAAGVAVRRKGKKWRVLSAVRSAEDFARRQQKGQLNSDAELLLAGEVMPDWQSLRDAPLLPKP